MTQGAWGTVELENTDNSTGTNTVFAGTLRSDIAAGQPSAQGTIQLQAGTLQLTPTSGSANICGPRRRGWCREPHHLHRWLHACVLDRNGNNSLAFQFGGNNGGATANLTRLNTGTLAIVPGSGNTNLGTSEQVIVNGSGANLPTMTNGIVAVVVTTTTANCLVTS